MPEDCSRSGAIQPQNKQKRSFRRRLLRGVNKIVSDVLCDGQWSGKFSYFRSLSTSRQYRHRYKREINKGQRSNLVNKYENKRRSHGSLKEKKEISVPWHHHCSWHLNMSHRFSIKFLYRLVCDYTAVSRDNTPKTRRYSPNNDDNNRVERLCRGFLPQNPNELVLRVNRTWYGPYRVTTAIWTRAKNKELNPENTIM